MSAGRAIVPTRSDRPPLYLGLAATDTARQAAYRSLLPHPLDAEAIGDIRRALHQGQPLGNERCPDSAYDGATAWGEAAWQAKA